MTDLLRDVRYALRVLIRNPGYAIAAIAALAIGIGANTAIFSEVDAVLLRPLPYPNAHRLAMVWGSNPKAQQGVDQLPIFGADFTEYQEQNQSFDRLAGFRYVRYNLMSQGYPEEIQAANVSAPFFQMLGVQPVLGRTFSADEDEAGGSYVVVLGNELWQRLTGSDPAHRGKVDNAERLRAHGHRRHAERIRVPSRSGNAFLSPVPQAHGIVGAAGPGSEGEKNPRDAESRSAGGV